MLECCIFINMCIYTYFFLYTYVCIYHALDTPAMPTHAPYIFFSTTTRHVWSLLTIYFFVWNPVYKCASVCSDPLPRFLPSLFAALSSMLFHMRSTFPIPSSFLRVLAFVRLRERGIAPTAAARLLPALARFQCWIFRKTSLPSLK